MNLPGKIAYLLVFSFVFLIGCSDDDDTVVAPPELLGTWQLIDAQTTIDGESNIRSVLDRYVSDQEIAVTEGELDEIVAVLSNPVTGQLNDSTTLEFESNRNVMYRDPQETRDGTWAFESEDILILSNGVPARFIVSTLTDTQLVLIMTNYEEYFRFPGIADFTYPEETQLQYTLTKQ